MNSKSLKKNIRVISQLTSFVVFIWLFLFYAEAAKYFIFLDPITAGHSILIDGFSVIFFITIISIIITVLLGRVFCGWICPFGTLNHFISFLGGKQSQEYNSKTLSIKYLLLTLLIISFFLGINLFGFLDPFSLITRGIASFFPSFQNIFSSNIITNSLSYCLLIIFFFFLLLNFYKHRFFCNVLCPAGALFGLFSKLSFFKLKIEGKCSSCKVCGKNCSYTNLPAKNFNNSECVLCFNCESECTTGKINFGFSNTQRNTHLPSMPDRRKIIGTIFSGLVFGSLLKSESNKNFKRQNIIRPPGAVKEDLFLDKCMRCGICTQVCETGFIKSANLDQGIENLWTPAKKEFYGYCEFECNNCSDVCPTGAIKNLSLSEKQKFKVGTAIINKNLCYTYSDGINCTACYDKCPLKDKAIKLRTTEIWTYRGRKSKVNQIYILQEECTGCGICEYVCVRKDEPAIFITSEDQEREEKLII